MTKTDRMDREKWEEMKRGGAKTREGT